MFAGQESFKRCDGEVSSNLNFEEHGFIIKELTSDNEIKQAYQLRHEIFCRELKWVPETETSLEIDEYDDDAVFLGVLNENGRLVAFIRIIMPHKCFMLEDIFSFLVSPDHKIRKESDTAELSRLCVTPDARTHIMQANFNTEMISMFLYKGVYQWCRNNGIRYLYFEVDYKFYKLLNKRGLTCELIGPPNIMPDGVLATAVILDWDRFDTFNAESRPDLLEWFNQGRSIPLERRQQRPEFYLRRRASS